MKFPLFLIAGIALAILLNASTYVLHPTQQAIVTSFGKIVGDPVTEPGLHFKTPFVQNVNLIERRVLEWDGPPQRMPTKDKVYLEIDTFARWRIADPIKFFQAVRDERTAQSRLDTMIGGDVMKEVARHDLVELIRTDKTRKAPIAEIAVAGAMPASMNQLPAIQNGRRVVAADILKSAAPRLLNDFGVELLDVQFKRLNYSREVQEKIHARMSSERSQIAEKFRSEGQGEAARIEGERERELRRVQSEAYRRVQEITGKADAEATRIYAAAYNSSPAAADFFNFTKTLETYGKIMDPNMTIVMSTESDLYRLMKELPAAPPIGNLPPPVAIPEPAPVAPPAPSVLEPAESAVPGLPSVPATEPAPAGTPAPAPAPAPEGTAPVPQ